MNFYYIFIILFIFTYFLNFFLIKNNLLLDSKKISIHKKFVQDRDKVSYVGGLVILVSCIFFWNENNFAFKVFLILIFTLGLLSDLGLLESPTKRFFLQSIVIASFLFFLDIKISSETNLIADYKFNTGMGNILYDYSGNINHAIIVNALWFGAKPEIITIPEEFDVPNDQGGLVKVQFKKSYWDTQGLRNTEDYTLQLYYENNWVTTNSTTAYADDNYNIFGITPINLNENLDLTEYILDFRVIAGMEEGNFASEVVQGYSVDNIVPSEPTGLMVSSASSDNITLDWTANTDDDLSHYLVYRDGELLGTAEISEYSDNDLPEPGEVNYSLKAVDVHGNQSNQSDILTDYVHYYLSQDMGSGNNLIGMPGKLENTSSQDLLEDLMEDGPDVIFMLGQGVGLFNTSDGWSGNLNNISPYSGYWLNIQGSYDWNLNFDLGDVDNCESYPITSGNNLLSYKWGLGNASTMDALGGEEFATENFNFILGQGVGLFNTNNGWSGNLNNLEEGKGYWVNTTNSSMDFRWGFDNCEEPPNAPALAKVESTIPEEYQVNQSTEQAFYLIEEIGIDGESPQAEDLILAYYNDILIGSANYSELTVLPVMGRDISEQTIGFIEAGQTPTLKLLKASGELVDLEADLEPFSNLLVSEVQSVTGSTAIIPTEYALHPAYPNPFNPVTNISYGLPMDTQVTLNIYNVEGRKINTLVQGLRQAGSHTIEWNAEGYPSGVYFVKLDAGEFTQTQKLMLVK